MIAARLLRPSPANHAPLEIHDMEVPRPGPGEVLIRVNACGVCRTDLQLAEGALAARRLPITPGHQLVGRVEQLGPGTTQWKPGDRVGVAWLAETCGSCQQCANGCENLCAQARFTGWDRDGGFAEFAVAGADFAFPLPERLSDVAAAPLLCGGVIGFRSLRLSGIQSGQRLGLFGFGASASLAIQVARHWGCTVFVFTRSERERRRALELGAAWAGSYEDAPPEPLHAAVTFAPAGAVVIRALQVLERGGTVAINAIHLDGIPAFDYRDLWWERSIRSVANFTRKDATEFLALAEAIAVVTTFDTFPLAGANAALRALAAGNVSGAAVLDCT